MKQRLVDGFFKACTSKTVPMDVVIVCTAYYDEVIHWKFKQHDLIYPLKEEEEKAAENENENENKNDDDDDNEGSSDSPQEDDHVASASETGPIDKYDINELNDNRLYGPSFFIHGIEFRLSFYVEETENEPNIYLNAWFPHDVERVDIYSEVYMNQNKAHFRDPVLFERAKWHWSSVGQRWLDHHYPMYLKCRDFKDFDINAHFEIASIRYIEESHKKQYFKPIYMNSECEYEWIVTKDLMDEMLKAAPNQIFISDTFDEYNNTWGLWIAPFDHFKSIANTDEQEKKRLCKITLCLIKKPWIIENMTVKVELTTSMDEYQNVFTKTKELDEWSKRMYLTGICKTTELEKWKDVGFVIKIRVEIVSVNNNEDFLIQFADIFG